MAELLLVEPTIVEHLSSTAVVWSESSHENLRSTSRRRTALCFHPWLLPLMFSGEKLKGVSKPMFLRSQMPKSKMK